MLPSSVEALHEWHDFYVAIGTASMTLLGAMFVVASIGGRLMTQERAGEIRLFVTPTVIHLSAAVLGSALTMVPSLQVTSLGILFGVGGAAGLVYSSIRAIQIHRRHQLELSDRFWYAAVPIVAYATMIAAAAMALLAAARALEVLAISIVLLIVAGIRNGWDLLLFIVGRPGV